jgi:hypothetical protein
MTDNDIDDYADQFLVLAKAAMQHGIATYIVVHTTDPIAMTSHTRYVNTADPVLAMGMVQAAQLYVQDEFFNNGEEEEENV